MERHWTNHGSPGAHSIPHDHKINWESPKSGIPSYEKPQINYPVTEYPDGAPEFKALKEVKDMNRIVRRNSPEENRFKTISEFEDCMVRGGEVEFSWKDIQYSATHDGEQILICKFYKADTAQRYDAVDKALEYLVGGERLQEVITQVSVSLRSF